MPFESFLVVAGLLIFGALTLGPIGFFMVLGLRNRLRRAEQRLAALGALLAQRAAQDEPATALRGGSVNEPPEPVASAQPDEAGVVAPPPPLAPPIAPPPAIVPQVAAANAPTEPPAAPPPASLEEQLGTCWAVWIGGVALGLGGLLLVRYSVEQGWFGPSARIVAGLLFAAGLVIAGEVLRRRQRASAPAPTAGQIPAVLTAAGTVAAFGTVYAAHALYHFIGPGPAFLALGLLGLATMLAAALHGPALAGLGLVGALAAPLLVESETPDPWPVVIYIGFVTASAYGLAWLRFWLWLALSAGAGGLLWGLVLLEANASGVVSAELFHALLQSLLSIALFVYSRRPTEPDGDRDFDAIGWALPSAFALLTLVTLWHSTSAGAFAAAAIAVALVAAVPLAASGLLIAEVAALTLTAGALHPCDLDHLAECSGAEPQRLGFGWVLACAERIAGVRRLRSLDDPAARRSRNVASGRQPQFTNASRGTLRGCRHARTARGSRHRLSAAEGVGRRHGLRGARGCAGVSLLDRCDCFAKPP